VENRTVGRFVVAAAVGVDLRPEDCRLLVLLEALVEVMEMLVEVREANRILEAPQQQMLLKIVPFGTLVLSSLLHFFRASSNHFSFSFLFLWLYRCS
jgi:hypothetical protein